MGSTFAPGLKLPYTVQWNRTVDQSLGDAQTLSVSGYTAKATLSYTS